jgi:hypothetical protein
MSILVGVANMCTPVVCMYCDEPLLCNERFSADVIAMAIAIFFNMFNM